MRTSIRTGVALSIAGLATGGIALLSAGAAEAMTTQQATQAAARLAHPVCRYDVEARHGLNVRKKPAGKKIGKLGWGDIVFAKKCSNPRGWVKLRGVPDKKKKLNGGWVARGYLARY